MRRMLVLIALVLPLSAGVAAGDEGARAPEDGSSRIVISHSYDDLEGESFFAKGVFDYEGGIGVLESDFYPLRIVTSEAIYEELSEDAFWPEPRGARRWTRTDASLLKENFRLPESPGYLIRFLRSAADSERIGTGVERGEEVTRYAAIWRLDRVLEEFPLEEHGSVRDLFDAFWPDAGERGVPVELAVDAQGRVRKAEFELGDYELGVERVTVELFDYGVPVAAKAPAATEVVTLEELERLAKLRAQECERLRKEGAKESAPVIARYCFECHAGEPEETDASEEAA